MIAYECLKYIKYTQIRSRNIDTLNGMRIKDLCFVKVYSIKQLNKRLNVDQTDQKYQVTEYHQPFCLKNASVSVQKIMYVTKNEYLGNVLDLNLLSIRCAIVLAEDSNMP